MPPDPIPAPDVPAPGTVLTFAGVKRGARLAAPLLIGFVPFGMVVGIVAHGQGLSLLEAGLMSAMVFAGASQIVALGMWAVPPPILGIVLATLLVNLRMAVMGSVLAPWLHGLRGPRLWAALFVMSDQAWALTIREVRDGGRDAGVLLGAGGSIWANWVVCGVLGYLAGAAFAPPPGHPIFFAAIASFVAMLVSLWRGMGDIAPWVVAAATALLVSHLLPGTAWHIVSGALVGSGIGAVRDCRRGSVRR